MAGWSGCRIARGGGQLWVRHRPEVEAEEAATACGGCFQVGGGGRRMLPVAWAGGRGERHLPPPLPWLGSALPSCTPSAAWTSRPPVHLRGPCVGSLKHLAAFSKPVVTSHEGRTVQTESKIFLVPEAP